MSVFFDQQRVERIFERPALVPPYDVTDDQVYVLYDPSGGSGAAAIVSVFFSHGRLVIAGMETCTESNPEKEHQVLHAHIDAVQNAFPTCQVVLIVDDAYGNNAQLVAAVLLRRESSNVVVLCENSTIYGIFSKATSLSGYWETMQEKLSSDGVFLHNAIVCTVANGEEGRRQEVVGELKKQLLALHKVQLAPQTPGPREVLGRGYSDELAVALLKGLYYAQLSQQEHSSLYKRTALIVSEE